MRMLGTTIDAEIAKLLTTQRATRQHALNSLLDNALRKAPFEDELRGAFLDTTRITRVMIIDFLVTLTAGENHLIRIDDDDIVAAINMGRECRKMLAAKTERNDRSKTANNKALRINQHPFLLDLGRLGRKRGHGTIPLTKANLAGDKEKGPEPRPSSDETDVMKEASTVNKEFLIKNKNKI